MVLNEKAYESATDGLIYDFCRPLDIINKEVTIDDESDGVVERGTVLDFDKTTKTYKVHEADGVAAGIVAAKTEYTSGDDEVIVPVYVSGNFKTSGCISNVDLDETDKENLRTFGIFLK